MIKYFNKDGKRISRGGSTPQIRMSINGGIKFNEGMRAEMKIEAGDRLVLASKRVGGKDVYLMATSKEHGAKINNYGKSCLFKVHDADFVRSVFLSNRVLDMNLSYCFRLDFDNGLVEDGFIFYPLIMI